MLNDKGITCKWLSIYSDTSQAGGPRTLSHMQVQAMRSRQSTWQLAYY